MHKLFTEEMLAAIVQWRDEGATWPWIIAAVEDQYAIATSKDALRRAYAKYAPQLKAGAKDSDFVVQALKRSHNLKRSNSENQRKTNYIVDYVNQQEKLLDKLTTYLDSATFSVKSAKVPKDDSDKSNKKSVRTPMTVELMYTDVHMGKLGDSFNRQVCIARTQRYMEVVSAEIERKSNTYDIERIVLFLGGDNIENANIHGAESAKGCEAPTPDQILWYIDCVFRNIILPLADYKIPIDVVCITGNHDRQDERKTFHYPGYDSEAWIMYNVLLQMTTWAGIKNFTWHIPKGIYHVLDIYGNKILYEHGDHVHGLSRTSLVNHLHKRSQQVGSLIDGIRFGHWHEYLAMDEGRVVVNASVCGVDSYADVKGFSSRAGQVVNFYVNTTNRRNKFFHSLLVQLED